MKPFLTPQTTVMAKANRHPATTARVVFRLAAVMLWTVAAISVGAAEPISLSTSRLMLNLEDPGQDRAGKVRFAGGIAIRSDAEEFGGLSGLALSPAGDRIISVSDRGFWFTALLVEDDLGRLVGLEGAEYGPMLDDIGDPLRGKWRDAESVEIGPAGTLFVSFEREHRVWRYQIGRSLTAARPVELRSPLSLDSAPKNGGIEALTVLPNGEILAITEDLRDENKDLRGWLMHLDVALPITLRATGEFKPTDLTVMPDGNLLLLERRFSRISGLGIRLSSIETETVKPHAMLISREIARFKPALTIDNFEGIAARAGPDGKTWIYIVSDDNFNAIQRTLLLKFELIE